MVRNGMDIHFFAPTVIVTHVTQKGVAGVAVLAKCINAINQWDQRNKWKYHGHPNIYS